MVAEGASECALIAILNLNLNLNLNLLMLMEHSVTVPRRKTRQVWVGKVPVGGDAPISVQSMTKTDPHDLQATVRQVRRLERAGCEIVRVAVPDERSARLLSEIRARISIPLVADIHFNYRLALLALEGGIDKLRINPGNIGSRERIEQVVRAAGERGVPIRIGVNSGSVEKDLLEKYGHPLPQALVESALRHVEILERLGFREIVISLKASDVLQTIEAYRRIATVVDYPLHLGITAAGTPFSGTIRSAAGIGSLLSAGIGDTLRVSLTGDPVREVQAGVEILKSFNLREGGPTLISCPTCGRCEIDLVKVARDVERSLRRLGKPLTVAVMGCAVNGPGEAREADLGIAGGRGVGLLFRRGKIVRKVKEKELRRVLLEEAEAMDP